MRYRLGELADEARLAFPIIGLALLVTAGGISGAPAQERDIRPLMDRLDRLERDMNMVQRQVYRGGSGGAPAPLTPSDNVGSELRMDQLEGQMRTLTGQMEELNYAIDQVRRRLDKLQGDVDFRVGELEKNGGAKPGAGAPPVLTPPGGAQPQSGQGQPALSAPPGASQIGGPRPPSAPPAAPPASQATLPTGNAQDQYNQAFGLLRQADYVAAEQALRAFVQRNPTDPLAGNAQYWLGETFYVRGDYNNAAATFAEAYRKYPQSGKGADSLLKLGMSLANIGQKRDACLTLAQLDKDFPKSAPNIAEKAKSEKQRLGC